MNLETCYNSPEYKKWRTYILKRDRHKCQLCGEVGGELNVHHIKPKAIYPELIYDKSNGITLCVRCHMTITGKEALFEKLFRQIVDHTLTLEYIMNFFKQLTKDHVDTVYKFLKHKIWQKLPEQLVKKVKLSQTKKRMT